MKPIEELAAYGAHALIYVLLFAIPISGFLMSSAKGFPVSIFGWFTMPLLIAPDKALGHLLANIHVTLIWVLLGVVSLHALAALLHHFYHKDDVLRKMLPSCCRKCK